MNDMKGRLDAQDGTIAELRNANNRLQADNDKLQDKIRELDGKLRDATKEKGTETYWGHFVLFRMYYLYWLMSYILCFMDNVLLIST